MGSNYELFVLRADGIADHISAFLKLRGLCSAAFTPLKDAEIADDKAILYGPPENGWLQVVSNCGAFSIDFEQWFHNNALSAHCSRDGNYGIHLWSLDSGYVAGYSVYSKGRKIECDSVFSKSAKRMVELMPGVVVPPRIPGLVFQELATTAHNFACEIALHKNPEIGLAAVNAKFGFGTHLIDFYDAVDEKAGVTVNNGKYLSAALTNWTAVLIE